MIQGSPEKQYQEDVYINRQTFIKEYAHEIVASW